MKFYDISRTGTVGIFLWNKLTSLYGLKFHMHVSDDDSNMFCKFDEIWWTLKKCWNFMIFWRAGSVSIFLWKIELLWIGWNFTCMFLMMIPICSASLMKFGELWKKLKFDNISRAGTVGIFLWKNLTSLNGLEFHMHVSDDDSNKFCKFDEIRWILKKKCWNFIFQRAGTVGLFPWNKLTSLNGLKFHMHVSDDDSYKFCKFDEIWWTLKKCWNLIIFLGPALSAFFCEKFNFSEWAGISLACFWWWFQYVLQIWWNKVNFEKNGEISWYF